MLEQARPDKPPMLSYFRTAEDKQPIKCLVLGAGTIVNEKNFFDAGQRSANFVLSRIDTLMTFLSISIVTLASSVLS